MHDDNLKEEETFNKQELRHYGSDLNSFIEGLNKAIEQKNLTAYFDYVENIPGDKFLGRGVFRKTFSFDDDYVIKVACPDKDAPAIADLQDPVARSLGIRKYLRISLSMNRKEAEFLNKDKSGIYPKVYKAHPYGAWVIEEKVTPIKDDEQFMTFFPKFTKLVTAIRKQYMDSDTGTYEAYMLFRKFLDRLDSHTFEEMKNDPKVFNLFSTIYDLKKARQKAGESSDVKFAKVQILLNDIFITRYSKDPDETFTKIYRSFKNSEDVNVLRDIKTDNSGVTRDGNFVIIDPGFDLGGATRKNSHEDHFANNYKDKPSGYIPDPNDRDFDTTKQVGANIRDQDPDRTRTSLSDLAAKKAFQARQAKTVTAPTRVNPTGKTKRDNSSDSTRLNESDEESIVIDFKQINESWFTMFGSWVEYALTRMMKGLNPNLTVKGNRTQVESFGKALASEKKYLETFVEYGLNDPRTYRSKAYLENAVKKFERKTGLKWPYK